MALAWKAVTMLELVWGRIVTSPVPTTVVLRPLLFSHTRSDTSWVLPSCGVDKVVPFNCATEVMVDCTTSAAPPEAAPATIW